MNILFYFALIALSTAATIPDKCLPVYTREYSHKNALKTEVKDSYQMTIDYNTNTLFFSYTDTSDDDSFRSAYIDLNTKAYDTVPGINGGFASAVDQKNHIVYLGGSDGVYTFDYETKKATHIGKEENDHSIWQMFFKDVLTYATLSPNGQVFTFENGVPKRFEKFEKTDIKVKLIVFDKDDNIFIANESGLFSYAKGKNEAFKYALNEDDDNIIALTTDIKGEVYFSTPKSIYHVNQKDQQVEKIFSTESEDISGFAITADDALIYAEYEQIMQLKAEKDKCYRP